MRSRGVGRLAAIMAAALAAAEACSTDADCPAGQYCDSRHNCDYYCSVEITPTRCNAAGGDCCSAAFLHNCPSNPAHCPAANNSTV